MKNLSLNRLLDFLRRKKNPSRSHESMVPATAPQHVYTPYDEKRVKRQLSDRLAAHKIANNHKARTAMQRGETDRGR